MFFLERKRSLKAVQTKFHRMITRDQLWKWQKEMKRSGDAAFKHDLFKIINDYVLERFVAGKENQAIMHDRDLRRWAIAKSIEVKLPSFKASNTWLLNFKLKNSIISRKITKFVHRSYTSEFADIEKSAKEFVLHSLTASENYLPSHIFNTDQSGIQFEMRTGRTLEYIGEKHINKAVGSVAATTHSLTIQPVISKAGDLLSPLFVCLQEKGGVFGPHVKSTLHPADNLYVVASKSGKLTKQLMLEWFSKVYFPNAPASSILYIDSWTCYNDRNAIKRTKPHNKELKLLQIPPKTTPLIQPLDVHFFRTWKQFMRLITDHVLLDQIDIAVREI